MTADCVPLLLYDKQKNMVAAIHAGWRGAFKGIIEKVIKFMTKKGCKKRNIIAAIGPCIKQNNYSVKEDFQKNFLKKIQRTKYSLKRKKNDLFQSYKFC